MSEKDKKDLIAIDPPDKYISGVKSSVAKKVYNLLESGRRYFGVSGASLSWQAFSPDASEQGIKPELAKIGLEGERETSNILKDWMKDKPNVVFIDSVHIRKKGEKGSWENVSSDSNGWEENVDEEEGYIDRPDTDHVLVIGSQVILIDSKKWKNKRRYGVSSGNNPEILRTDNSFPGGKVHATQAAHLWLNYLKEETTITPLIHIVQDEVWVKRDRNWYSAQFRIVETKRFVEILDDIYKDIDDYDKKHIDSSLVSQIVVCAVKPFDPYDRVFSKSIKDFK